MISTDFAESFDQVKQYNRLAGGSPANLAGNLARLGRKVGLIATVGEDGMGDYLQGFVSDLGLDTRGLRRVSQPTTLILVTRSREVSDFEAYRLAMRDAGLKGEDLDASVIAAVPEYHKQRSVAGVVNAPKRCASRCGIGSACRSRWTPC